MLCCGMQCKAPNASDKVLKPSFSGRWKHIFTTSSSAANIELAISAGIEVVQVERPTRIDSHMVLIDNYSGARAAVEHLLQLGHQRIGYLGKVLPGSPEVVDNQRFRGYMDALEAAGIQASEQRILLELDPYSIQDGNKGLRQLLANDPDVTAVLVFSDIMASGVLQAAYELRLRILDDLSVIGFDNTYAAYLSPALSTVAIPMVDVGKAAAQVAIDAIEQPPAPVAVLWETAGNRADLGTRLHCGVAAAPGGT